MFLFQSASLSGSGLTYGQVIVFSNMFLAS